MQDNFSIRNWKNTVVYKEEFDRSMLDKFELDVYGYQTQDFDICPGAQSLYKDILAGKYGDKDETTVKTLARLQDDLFNMEKKALAYGQVDNSFLENAEKLESQIYRLADSIGLRDEHDYVAGHIDRIANVTGNPEDALGEQEEAEIDDDTIELEIPDESTASVDTELQTTMTKNDRIIKAFKDVQDKMQASLKKYKEAETTEEKDAAKEELKALTPEFQSAKKAYEKIKAVKI